MWLEKELVSTMLGVSEASLSTFTVEDTFNPGNTLQGYISTSRTKMYGALCILRVNGEDVDPQVVYATPKIKYPFVSLADGRRKFSWPDSVGADFYEKYDGTNVLAYSYSDVNGDRYLTYKTRLTPVMRANRFGDFVSMWKDILEASTAEKEEPILSLNELGYLVKTGQYAFAFEMIGKKNPHLINYGVDLDAYLLFGVRQRDGAIIPPSKINEDGGGLACQIAAVMETASEGDDLTVLYDHARQNMASSLTKVDDTDDESQFFGSEGRIVYLHQGDGTALMFKCKPPQIEAIHWTSDSIPVPLVMEAIWKHYESCDDEPTVDDMVDHLLEDFPLRAINKSMPRIKKALVTVAERLAFRDKVSSTYNGCGLTFEEHGRGPVMREMSNHFDRKSMSNVFNALRELGYVE